MVAFLARKGRVSTKAMRCHRRLIFLRYGKGSSRPSAAKLMCLLETMDAELHTPSDAGTGSSIAIKEPSRHDSNL